MVRGREPGHVQADLGDDDLRRGDPDAGDLIQSGHRLGERGDLLIDPGLHDVDVGVDAVDPGQHGAQQERVVVGEPPGERLLQSGGLASHRPAGHVGQDLRVAFPGDQRGHHRPPGHPEDVAGHHRQLDLRVFQQLFHPLLLRRPGGDQVHPVPGQIP